MPRTLLFLYAESPVHAGADASLGALDLPMQRDKHTGLPVIWGQSLKGALRSHARSRWGPDFLAAFGAEPPGASAAGGNGAAAAGGNGADTAAGAAASESSEGDSALVPGSLSIGDAELVAFPAPTLVATFAWLTSGLSLARVARKAALANVSTCPQQAPHNSDQGVALVTADRWKGDQVVLGPYVVSGRDNAAVGEWAGWLAKSGIPGDGKPAPEDHHGFFREKFAEDLVAVGDELLARISVECAEVTPRVQLEVNQKTVRQGPFHTEYLPTESLLAAVIESTSDAHLTRLRDLLHGEVLRVGGDETIGKGLVWCSFVEATATP